MRELFQRHALEETPKPDDPIFAQAKYELIASPQGALESAAALAIQHNIVPIVRAALAEPLPDSRWRLDLDFRPAARMTAARSGP